VTRPVLAGLAIFIGLALLVFFADMALLIFAAILVAAVLDSCILLLRRILPIPRVMALAITMVFVTTAAVAMVVAGGINLPGQIESLLEILGEAWRIVAKQLNMWGVQVSEEIGLGDVIASLPEPQTMFGGAGAVLGTGLGFLSNIVIVMLMGVFMAADPARYRDGLALLVPVAWRERLVAVLNRIGWTLQRWIVGQLIIMVFVGGATLILLMAIGIEYALPLALIVTLLNFIPFVGPILGFVPIGLTMIGQDWTTALLVLGGYTVIQQIDANILSPLIQDRVVNLAPALTIAFLLFMGVAFGPIGIALATPILAALRVALLELYVGNFLGDTEQIKAA